MRPRIIYLDEPSYLPDSAVATLEAVSDFEVFHDKPSPDVAAQRLASADVAIVEWTEITREMLERAPRLKSLVLVTTGFGFVDVLAARDLGKSVSNCPNYSRQSVAEHVVSAMLALSKRMFDADRLARSDPQAEYTDHIVGRELYRRTLGVVGYGSIGSWVAKLGRGFDMNVLAHSRRPIDDEGVQDCGLDDLLVRSDFVALTASLNDSSRQLLDARAVALMKDGAILVNIAGNGLLDQEAVAEALSSGKLFGAAFDDGVEQSLAAAPNTLITPGVAWYTQESLDRNVEMFVQSAIQAMNGVPRFVVN